MGIYREIEEQMNAALKAHDDVRKNALRMVRARMKQHAIDTRIAGEIPDAEAHQVIATYVRQLQKAIPEFEKGGAAAEGKIAELRAEIAILQPFLPTLLDETATREIVRRAVEASGRPPIQKAGMVIGMVMKEHKGEVDPVLVKRLVEEALTA